MSKQQRARTAQRRLQAIQPRFTSAAKEVTAALAAWQRHCHAVNQTIRTIIGGAEPAASAAGTLPISGTGDNGAGKRVRT